ncbi:hypothetical protein [Nonomuraea wenchangensis]|uniref:hypothetical protein n=1 Tax=Nonomuraea wenchangensis TaxID=568860 RepID=UPI00378E6838
MSHRSKFDVSKLKVSTTEPDVRKLLPDEVLHLTPWVISNLGMLGDALDMRLEFVAREVPLGTFRADILARDDKGRKVVIENQFGPSDHGHFGQVVLYALESHADVVVWLSTGWKWRTPHPLRLEHRRALAQLNEVFIARTSFYGVELSFSSEPRDLDEPDGPLLPHLQVVAAPVLDRTASDQHESGPR